MDHTHSQEYVPQCQHNLPLVDIAPSESAPRPPDPSPRSSTARLYRASAFCRPYRLRYSVSPNRPRAMSSLANAMVTVPLPAVAVEVKRPRRLRAPSGIWGDGTELDGVDYLNADPTLERQFHVQAKGVHEGGTVKRFNDRGKGREAPVGTGTRVTNATVGPGARAPANGTIDLGKFREPEAPKKRKRERERNRSLHCTRYLWPRVWRCCCRYLQGTESKEEKRTWAATAQVAEPDSEYEWDQSPNGLWRFFTLTSTWH